MRVNFTNLYKLIPEKKKIFRKINSLIRHSKFVGGKEIKIFEENFSKKHNILITNDRQKFNNFSVCNEYLNRNNQN